jgi:hypothetical protein
MRRGKAAASASRTAASSYPFPAAKRNESLSARGTVKCPSRSGSLSCRYRWFESISLQQTVCLSPAVVFEGREPRFSARVWAAGLATGSAETRQTLHCGPTGCNISVGPYSSTAVPLRWSAKMPRRSRQSWVYSALNVRGSLNSDWAQAKPSTIRWSCQTSGRRECSRSFSDVKSLGCRPSRIACVISGAR